jgi:hypothetical protein
LGSRSNGLPPNFAALNAISRGHLQVATNLGVNFAFSLPVRPESKCRHIFLGFIACLHS